MPLLRRLQLSAAAMLVLGVAAGFVWELLAEPIQMEVVETGLLTTESASKGQFSVVVTFVLIGAVASIAWGVFTALTLRDLGWVVTPFIVVLTLIASVIAWRLGVFLGPPDPSSVKGLSVGDRVPARLEIDAIAPFLVWPIAGLAGFVGTTLLGTRLGESPQERLNHA